nr:uncharacterized protein LOC129266823 [Lytechinus pictus]
MCLKMKKTKDRARSLKNFNKTPLPTVPSQSQKATIDNGVASEVERGNDPKYESVPEDQLGQHEDPEKERDQDDVTIHHTYADFDCSEQDIEEKKESSVRYSKHILKTQDKSGFVAETEDTPEQM